MSTYSTASSSTSVYTTPAFWERLWRTGGIQFHFLLHHCVPRLRPSAADWRVARRTRRILRRGARADPDCRGVLWAGDPQPDVVRGGAPDHLGGCRTRRLGRGGNRFQRSGGSAFPPAHHGGRSPRLLDRRLPKSDVHIGTERLSLGRRRLDFVPAGDADHVRSFRALAGPADLECALRGRGRSRRTRLAGRHHVAEGWILVTVRRLFAVRLARHRRRVGGGREPGPPNPKSCYTCWMVMPMLARVSC